MLYGLYLSAQGAEVQSFKQDVLAHNLANASTTAFKRAFAVIQAHAKYDETQGQTGSILEKLADQTGGTATAEVMTDFGNGPLQKTGQDFDIAIAGEGFLRVQSSEGEQLTRDGRMTIGTSGQLVTFDSHQPILDADGQPIQIQPQGGPISISSEGVVSQGSPATVLGRLGVVLPEQPQALQRVGNNLYRPLGNVVPAPANTQIRQGFIEGSTVKPVTEMLDLIQSSRNFEANINMIRYQDESLGNLLQSLGRR